VDWYDERVRISEQYHVLLSSGLVRKGPGAFRARCYPAAF
jgi:hypothetical protein